MSDYDENDMLPVACNLPAVVEPVAEEHQEYASYDMNDIFRSLLLQSNHAAHETEAKLQVEESGNKVAGLQGFCAGIRDYKSAAKKAGFDVPQTIFDTANRMTPWIQVLDNEDKDTECNLSLSELRVFSGQLDALVASDSYMVLEDAAKQKVSEKKDWLFGDAKSGRDLFWARGWHNGFSWVREQIKELRYWKDVKEQQAAKKAKEKAESLPFGDEDEDEEF